MSNTNDKSSELGRNASLRTSRRLSSAQGANDDYDHDYEVQAAGIADGFRPVEVAQNHASRLSVSSIDSTSARVPPPRPSSVSKPHRLRESLTLRHDGSSTSESPNEPISSSSSSVSTGSPSIGPEAPYEGPSGPSFPYQMYPQNVRLARTASLATTATAPISEQSYNGPRGPTHPYGMYPQNTVPVADGMVDRHPQRDINVGFPGTTDNYQRRLGPEGEEAADLIGPDGHTEQLPPYTRYPEETYQRKALGVQTPQPTQPRPMLAIPGAGGIGMATRNPEFASTDDLSLANSPQSRQSVRSSTSDASHRQMHAGASPVAMNEKSQPKNWKTIAKRKVWGVVPFWAIVLAIVVLLMMGIVLGAVIGTVFSRNLKKRPPPDGPPSSAVAPSDWDTQPMTALPENLPPLPEGTFAMPLMNTRAPNTCFKDTTQAQAWNCNIVFAQLSMTVQRLAGAPNISDYTFAFWHNDTYTLKKGVYSYGMQPPDLSNVKLRLVNDLYETSRGPAWNFEIPYNKTIVLPEPFLTPTAAASAATPSTTDKEKREDRRMWFSSNFKRKGVAQVGDRPWVCLWDGTILEAFIYADQNTSLSQPIEPDGPNTDAASPTTTTSSETTKTPQRFAIRDELLPSQGVFDPKNRFNPPVTDPPSPTIPSATPTPSLSSWFDKDSGMPPNPRAVYPRVVKVEERRVAGFADAAPVCTQYEILNENDEPRPALDPNGNVIEVQLSEQLDDEESESSGPEKLRRRAAAVGEFLETLLETRGNHGARLANDMSDCGCMWWLT
ncbi:hypothetical protein F4779DRAFT_214692 [Xylariaceae sp. FL0662B]|nr:hypothetical protein F4779DRAFT_214692 [Xylariaceae sp. FL0662B]